MRMVAPLHLSVSLVASLGTCLICCSQAMSQVTTTRAVVSPSRQPEKRPKLRPLPRWIAYTDPIRKPAPPGRQEGRVDIEKTIEALKLARVECFAFRLWRGPDELADLKLLLPAAQRAGIQVWASFVPPSMGANSMPHRGAFDDWAREFAELGKQFANFTALYLIELDQGRNPRFLPPPRVAGLHDIVNAVGMNLVGEVYDVVPQFVQRYAGSLDAVVVDWVHTDDVRNLAGWLAGAKALLPRGMKVLPSFFASRVPWAAKPPSPQLFYYELRASLQQDGCVLRRLDLKRPATEPSQDGISVLLLTTRDFIDDVKNGRRPAPPRFSGR